MSTKQALREEVRSLVGDRIVLFTMTDVRIRLGSAPAGKPTTAPLVQPPPVTPADAALVHARHARRRGLRHKVWQWLWEM